MGTITKSRIRSGLLSIVVLSGASGYWCHALPGQAYTPPPPPLTTAPCIPTKSDPCTPPTVVPPTETAPATADKFPFPGAADDGTTKAVQAPHDASGSTSGAPKKFPFPGEASSPDANTPQVPQAPSVQDPAKGQFPFPGEPPESSSSSSSSSSSGALDDPSAGSNGVDPNGKPALKDAGSSGSTRFARKHLAKVEDTDQRELEDLDVAHYYMTTGNFNASYLRAKDALRLYPDDENAHMAIAVSAEKLHKNDEAVQEYKAYLKLAPDGVKAKEAERSLKALHADR